MSSDFVLYEKGISLGNGIDVIYRFYPYRRWILHVFLVVGKDGFGLFDVDVGYVSDFWLANFYGDFEDDD